METAVFGEDRLKKKVMRLFSTAVASRKERKTRTSGGSLRHHIDKIGNIVKQGLPSEVGKSMKEMLGLTDKEIAETLGTSEKTLQRKRKKNEPFSLVESDRLYRMARIFALASHVLGEDDLAREWLHEPQYGLEEEIPIEMMKTEAGAKEVEELLYRIEYGVLA